MPPALHSLLSPGGHRNEEIATLLLQGGRFRAEHIASHGASSPAGFWYDQDLPEWVTLLQGTASLEFEDGILQLNAGDSLTIPPNLRHRVSATSPDATWLALHFEPGPAESPR